MAMQARGFGKYALGPIIMLYAQNALRGLGIFGRGRKNIEPKQEHEKRVVLETVSLLPREKNAMSISFLSMLLRAAVYLETTIACRLDLEKRIGMQLEQGVLDDLLIPSFSLSTGTTFDVDTVQRILANYLEHEVDGSRIRYNTDNDYTNNSSGDVERVGKLMESYLAEVASHPNMEISKFISLAEMIPEQARFTEDGIYRSIKVMASQSDSWLRECNEAFRLVDDITSMMSERGSLSSGPEAIRHTSAIRRKITILGIRLDSLDSLLSKLCGKQPMSEKEFNKRQDMILNMRNKAKQMASTLNMSSFANMFELNYSVGCT